MSPFNALNPLQGRTAAAGAAFPLFRASRLTRFGWGRPLAAWRGPQRAVVAVAIAIAVCAGGTCAVVGGDLTGLASAREALATTRSQLDAAQRELATLPALRHEHDAAEAAIAVAPVGPPADDIHAVAALAAASGLNLLTLEPGMATGTGIETTRPIRAVLHGGYEALVRFFRALPDLPMPAEPVRMTLGRDGGALAADVTLNLHGVLPSLRQGRLVGQGEAMSGESSPAPDPFAAPDLPGPVARDLSAAQLVGVLRDRHVALALFEASDGPIVVRRGGLLGGERVAQIDASGVTLTAGEAGRVLRLREPERP